MNSGESTSGQKRISDEWQDYLTATENPLSEYIIGTYKVLTTDKRIMLMKKFPKSFTEIKYDEILSIEHYTDILWGNFLKASAYAIIASYIYNMYVNRNLTAVLSSILLTYLPEIHEVFPINPVILAAVAGLVFSATVNLIDFILSVSGYLKFTRKNRMPFKVNTRFTPQVKQVIKEIEGEISKSKETSYVQASERTFERAVEKPAAEKRQVPTVTIYGRLKKEFEDVKKDSIALVSAESKDHAEMIASLLKILVNERKMNGIYISASKPYEQILRAMEQAEVKTNKMFFIDCISHMAGKLPEKAENAVFIENPSSLEEVSMYIDKVLVRLGEPKFILLDSLSSLLIYNNERSVEEFTHLVINKVRIEKVGGIIISIKQKEAEALTKTLVPMCDKEIILD